MPGLIEKLPLNNLACLEIAAFRIPVKVEIYDPLPLFIEPVTFQAQNTKGQFPKRIGPHITKLPIAVDNLLCSHLFFY